MLNPNFAVLNFSYVNCIVVYMEYKVNKYKLKLQNSRRDQVSTVSTRVIGYADSRDMLLSTTYDKYLLLLSTTKK